MSDSQGATPLPDGGLLAVASVNAAVFFIFLGAFLVLRPIFPRIYSAKLQPSEEETMPHRAISKQKKTSSGKEPESQQDQSSSAASEVAPSKIQPLLSNVASLTYDTFLSWFTRTLRAPDAYVAEKCGLDGLTYIRFQRFLIAWSIIVCLLVITTCLPINLLGENEVIPETEFAMTPYISTTVGHIPQSSPRLWTHVIVSFLISIITYSLMHMFLLSYARSIATTSTFPEAPSPSIAKMSSASATLSAVSFATATATHSSSPDAAINSLSDSPLFGIENQTILFRGIPISLRETVSEAENRIRAELEQLYSAPSMGAASSSSSTFTSPVICVRLALSVTSKMRDLVDKREELLRGLEHAEVEFARKGKRPTTGTFLCCFKRRDAIVYYSSELRETEAKIRHYRNIRVPVLSGPLGSISAELDDIGFDLRTTFAQASASSSNSNISNIARSDAALPFASPAAAASSSSQSIKVSPAASLSVSQSPRPRSRASSSSVSVVPQSSSSSAPQSSSSSNKQPLMQDDVILEDSRCCGLFSRVTNLSLLAGDCCAFVTFSSPAMAARVMRDFKAARQRDSIWDWTKSRFSSGHFMSSFTSSSLFSHHPAGASSSSASATAASERLPLGHMSSVLRSFDGAQVRVTTAPPPSLVVWTNLHIGEKQRALRRAVGIFGMFLLIFFWSIPIAALSRLDTFTKIPGLRNVLDFVLTLSPFAHALLVAYLPTLVLLIWGLYLGDILRVFSKREGYISRRQIERQAMKKYFSFYFVNLLIIQAIVQTGFHAIVQIVLDPKDNDLSVLAGSVYLQNISSFFASFMVQSALQGVGISMALLSAVFWYMIYSTNTVTDREKRRAYKESVIPFPYIMNYPNVSLIASMVLFFAPFVPIISIIGVGYFILKHFADRYLLMHVSPFRPERDTRGYQVRTAVKFVNAGLVLAHICSAFFFRIYGSHGMFVAGLLILCIDLAGIVHINALLRAAVDTKEAEQRTSTHSVLSSHYSPQEAERLVANAYVPPELAPEGMEPVVE